MATRLAESGVGSSTIMKIAATAARRLQRGMSIRWLESIERAFESVLSNGRFVKTRPGATDSTTAANAEAEQGRHSTVKQARVAELVDAKDLKSENRCFLPLPSVVSH